MNLLNKTSFVRKNAASVLSDLVNPVNSQLMALLEIKKNSVEKLNKEEKILLEYALISNRQAKNLIDLYFIAENISKKKMFLNYEKFDFLELINEIVSELKVLREFCNIIIKINCKENIIISADRDKIKKVIENLVFNSLNITNKKMAIIINANQENKKILFQIKRYGTDAKINFFEKNERDFRVKSSMFLNFNTINRIICCHYGKTFIKNLNDEASVFGFVLPFNPKSRKTKSEQSPA